ncbi:DUF6114 domain-containing protein [Actinoplanes oblitus]|uniref:DUF6114 domain-containing protein n=1 Tax=Actinoplanes oblitus TaxID=3040509 RepID=A0ABY8WMD6_9ACTN|nr:DUF6114 domain-containing protein [Actinoplanes oblitus]WIM99056.1 DUF6114 domain-containing protein [Actinoplanes oblitus]
MATDNFWGKFRRWRRSRPFWGGLFLLWSAFFLFLSSNLSLLTEMRLEIHVGPQGFLSYVLPVLMLLCGLLVWFTPAQRMFYGIIGLLTAVYSFIGLNFGGWFIGMLNGIIGGALAISWTPRPTRPDVPKLGPTDATGPDNHAQGPSGDPLFPGENTEAIQIAGHDDRPHETSAVRPPAQSDSSILPGFDQPRGDLPGPRRGLNRKALAIIMVPALVGATVVIGSRVPASADDCPEGLPSIATSVSPSATASTKASATKSADSPASAKPDGKLTTTGAADSGKENTTPASASASASASAATDDDGNPILDGISDVVDGVGNLLGLGDDEASSSPSASPSPSATETAKPTTEPTDAATTTPATGGATAATSAPAKSTSATPSVSASTDVIPCLGARQENKIADDGGIPKSAIKPGKMKVSSLTLYNSTYEGVADVPTQNGVIKALQLNMTKAVNEPFSLEIDEPGNAVTTVKSKKLVTEGNVKFFTPKMTGNLFGLIPITFTPEQPPPLTLPLLWFTNVTIDLAYVSCDTLTASPITITES